MALCNRQAVPLQVEPPVPAGTSSLPDGAPAVRSNHGGDANSTAQGGDSCN